MSLLDRIRVQMRNLVDLANSKTGKNDTDLTSAVGTLIDGYGQGGDISQYCVQNEVSGTDIVTCDYVNENEHDIEVQLSSDTITDFNGIEVKAVGKNLLNCMDFIKYNSDDDRYGNSPQEYTLVNGVLTLEKANGTANQMYTHYQVYLIKGMQYTLSCKQSNVFLKEDTTTSVEKMPSIALYKDNTRLQNYPSVYKCSFSVDESRLYEIHVTFNEQSKSIVKTEIHDLQLELGSYMTPYVPYIEPIVYQAETDGTVKVKSIAPLTHLVCDTEGVNITAKYYLSPTADYDVTWDSVQLFGSRENYRNAFGIVWNDKNFKPKYDFVITNATYMFYYASITNLKELLEKQNVVLDFSKCTSISSAFVSSQVTHIPPIDLSRIKQVSSTFSGCTQLKELTLLNIKQECTFSGAFNNCTALEDFDCTGVIGSSISFAQSPNLSQESILSIGEALADLTGQTAQTIAFHPDIQLTSPLKMPILAKNWNIAQ